MNIIGESLLMLRESLDLLQAEIADGIVAPNYISKVESGTRATTSQEVIESLATKLAQNAKCQLPRLEGRGLSHKLMKKNHRRLHFLIMIAFAVMMSLFPTVVFSDAATNAADEETLYAKFDRVEKLIQRKRFGKAEEELARLREYQAISECTPQALCHRLRDVEWLLVTKSHPEEKPIVFTGIVTKVRPAPTYMMIWVRDSNTTEMFEVRARTIIVGGKRIKTGQKVTVYGEADKIVLHNVQ
jgi:transcriptional regulator with XRE-family HTH domain